MPDKRQQSKQRRAARNRATREALAARRENAEANATSSPSSSSSSSRSSASSRSTGRAAGRGTGAAADRTAAAPSGPPPPGLRGVLQSRRPGDKAVVSAFVFALAGAVALLFYRVPVDDRGEMLPVQFRGVVTMLRERLTGAPLPDESRTLLDVSGPEIFLMLGLPVAVTVFALWGNRRPDRSRMLTFAMLALAGTIILAQGIGIFFFPAMIALAVAGFRVRRADVPARTAERATRPRGVWGRRDRDVIDVDSAEVDAAADDAGEAGGRRSDDAATTGASGAAGTAAGEVGADDDAAGD
ncbi:MAG TPA: hypothetical protein VFP06_13885, partial [Acidimicrobiales bacterium]|nr:hypothetical protein [Acidimicrobiales bacterium]